MSVRVRAGRLRHPVTINTVTKESDGMGGYKEEPLCLAKDRASIMPVSASERMKDGKMTMEITHSLRMRKNPDITITPGMTIIKDTDSRTFKIISMVNPEELGVVIDFLCREDV